MFRKSEWNIRTSLCIGFVMFVIDLFVSEHVMAVLNSLAQSSQSGLGLRGLIIRYASYIIVICATAFLGGIVFKIKKSEAISGVIFSVLLTYLHVINESFTVYSLEGLTSSVQWLVTLLPFYIGVFLLGSIFGFLLAGLGNSIAQRKSIPSAN